MGSSASKPSSRPVETKWFHEFEANIPSLKGKTVAITGTTSGTGYIVARTAIRKGAEHVLLLNRPSERATKAEAALKEEVKTTMSKTKIETIPCDLQDFESVRKAAEIIKSKYQAIDVLCNNAGVMCLEDRATKDGYDVQMQTNHLSHFLLTKELFPLLKKASELRGEARIANHSSSARKAAGTLKEKYFGKNGGNLGGNGATIFLGARWVRYSMTKLANTVFTLALVDRLGPDSKIVATSAEPGLAATNLETNAAQDGGMGRLTAWLMKYAQSAEDGSMPICAACFSPETKPGKIWEPSRFFGFRGPAVQDELEKGSTTESFRGLLWKASEEACGTFDLP